MLNLPKLRRALLLLAAIGLAAGFFLGPLAWDIPAALIAVVVAIDLINALRRGTLGVDIIALLAIVGALLLGSHLTAAIIALMVAGGTALEEYAAARARRELAALIGRSPRIAHRHDGAIITDIPVDAVRIGDILLVKPGETVPVDGLIADDSAALDEAALTGEPIPVTRVRDEPVRSGVVNAGGPFTLHATETADRSTYAAVVRLVQAAEAERPPMVRLADRWALWFLALTLVLGGGAWWVTGDPVRALAVLVVATPCPLILAAPAALVCGVSRAARRGIIVKGGSVLERLARVTTVLFDKTGTLTTGAPRVGGVAPMDDRDPDDVLRLAASLAQTSQHVISAAIVSAARSLDLRLSMPDDVEEIPGGGLRGRVGATRVLLGSTGLFHAARLAPPTEGPAARLAAASAAVAWVALDDQIAAALLLSDRVRPEAARALRALRGAGVRRLVMVSGDRQASAEMVGTALGLDAVHADQSPAGKIDKVISEEKLAPTLMIGDGINDAPALAAAHVGVAMGARGAAAAAEAADVVLLVDRLDRVAEAVTIARRARFIALESIVAGMALSGAAMIAAAFGYLPPVAGALLQELIDVAVILNALRVLAGGAMPAPLTNRAALDRVVDEHAQLRDLLERMRHFADRIEPRGGTSLDELRTLNDSLATILLPHQAAEENAVYPELAHRLGGRDPLGAMNRMHEEISHLSTSLGALVHGLTGGAASPGEAREARRLLYALDAVIGLHLAAEEELLSNVEDLPARG